MRYRLFALAHIIVISFSINIFSQGGTAVTSLLLKPGAEANGLAGSYTALARGGYAMYYNPAGLAQTEKFSWSFSYSDWLPDFNLDLYTIFSSVVYSYPKIGNFGFAVQYFDVGKFFDFGKYSHPYDLSLSVGYGKQFTETFSGGITLKYIHTKNYIFSSIEIESRIAHANAVAFDLGILFTNFLPELCHSKDIAEGSDGLFTRTINKNRGPSIAIVLSNMGSKIDYEDDYPPRPLPQNLRIGLAWTVVNNDLFGVTVSSDILKMMIHSDSEGYDSFLTALVTSWEKFKFEELEISFGLEIDITSLISLRVGSFNEDENYGNRNYYTYGFSVGPEYARFGMSFFDTIDKGHPLDNTIFFEGAVRL